MNEYIFRFRSKDGFETDENITAASRFCAELTADEMLEDPEWDYESYEYIGVA